MVSVSSPLLTREQAAQYLGVKPQTLSVWHSTGRYPLPVVKVGRCGSTAKAIWRRFLSPAPCGMNRSRTSPKTHVVLGSANSMTTPIPPKPWPAEVIEANIPAELEALPQWVVWRYAWKPDSKKPEGGKWDKPPINVQTGLFAQSNNPESWSSFEVAMTAYYNSGSNLDGIGFVPSINDDIVAIDLDKCRDHEGGDILPWSAEQRAAGRWDAEAPNPANLVTFLDSYARSVAERKGRANLRAMRDTTKRAKGAV